MPHTMTKMLLVTAIAGGLTTAASAQGFEPSGANRGYPHYAVAESAAFYIGQLQGSMSGAILAAPFESAPVGLYSGDYVQPQRPRTVIGRHYGPPPGSVTPMY